MEEITKLKGIIAPALTFFDKEGAVDFEMCELHIDWMLKRGVKGLFMGGTYGLGFLLENEEKMKLFKMASHIAKKKGAFVVAHVGSASLENSLALAKAAERVGAIAISAVTPFNIKYSDNQLVDYYEQLVRTVEIPVYAYNNPSMTGITIGKELLDQLVKRAGIAGLKDSSVNLSLISHIQNRKLIEGDKYNCHYISGTTDKWNAVKELKINTMIAGMCNYVPEVVNALYESGEKDNIKCEKIYSIMNVLSQNLKFTNSIEMSYIALMARGFKGVYARAPLSIGYEEKLSEVAFIIKRALDEIGAINV